MRASTRSSSPPIKNILYRVYGGKICVFVYLSFLFSLCIFCSGLALLFSPATNQTYINNLRLNQIKSRWLSSPSSKTPSFNISIKILKTFLTAYLQTLSYDPLYNRTDYPIAIFWLNFSGNSKVKTFRQNLGSLYLTSGSKGGHSESFCLEFIKSHTLHLLRVYQENINGFPHCSGNGLFVKPWYRIIDSSGDSSVDNSIERSSEQFQKEKVMVLKEICIIIGNRNHTLKYVGGCYNSNAKKDSDKSQTPKSNNRRKGAQQNSNRDENDDENDEDSGIGTTKPMNQDGSLLYIQAEEYKLYNFQDLIVSVRFEHDPYLEIKKFQRRFGYGEEYYREDLVSVMIDFLVFGGIGWFAGTVLMYLVLISLGRRRFDLE